MQTPLSLSENRSRMALSREEAARSLGVCVRTVDSLIADPDSGFPVARIGRKVLIPAAALEFWLTQRTQANGEV